MFYDNFIKLCEEIGLSPSRVVVQAGLSKGSIARWKDGGAPLNEAKKRIAEVMGISIPELMSGQIEKPAIQKDDGQVETFKRLFMQVKDQDRLDIIQKMLDMINRK